MTTKKQDSQFSKSNVQELKQYLKQTNMVNSVHKYKKDKLVTIKNSMDKYFDTLNNDYYNYRLGDKIMTVSDEQYDIITSSPSNNIRIIACAGSGKTTTIICRIKYLIDNGVLPSKIILMTFNVDAAKNMKKKLKEIFCGFRPNVVVGTIDSIACKFYHTYFKKEHNVGVQEYCTELLNYLKTPYGSLITTKYDYMFVDEFQDVNRTQYNTILEFYKAGTKIIVIGDDAQNIYKFRGSDMKYIIDLHSDIQHLKTFTLRNNYRSTPEVIHLANKSINYNKNQIPKQMLSNKQESSVLPELECFTTFQQLGNKVISIIVAMSMNNSKDQQPHLPQSGMMLINQFDHVEIDDISIISRNTLQLKKMEEIIEQHNKRNPDKKIEYISLIDNDNADTKAKIKTGHLTLTTIHKSKGLEWNTVFLIGCCDDKFPNKKDNLSMEEERRLFYVAVTRAKKHLYFYFNKMANVTALTYVSRFIQEVPRTSYNYVNKDESIYGLSTYDTIFCELDIFKIIKSFREEDFEQLRKNGLLDNLDPVTTVLHESTQLDQQIYDDVLTGDFCDFINRYGTRYIQSKNQGVDKIFDKFGFCVTRPCVLENYEYLIYLKNKGFLMSILKCIKILKNTDTVIDIQNIIAKYSRLVPTASEMEIGAIKSIISKAIKIGTNFKIKLKYIYFCNESILPLEFRKRMKMSYKNYDNVVKDCEEILNDVYNISLCQNIYGNRKRLLYRDDLFQLFSRGTEDMRFNIRTSLSKLCSEQVKTDKIIKVKKYTLKGIADYLDDANITLMRLSSTDNFNLVWLLQIIGLVSLIEYNKKNSLCPDKINKYSGFNIITANIYNPLRGIVFSINLSEWINNYNKSQYFIEYLDYVRARQNNNVTTINTSIKLFNPTSDNKNDTDNNNINFTIENDKDEDDEYYSDLMDSAVKGYADSIEGNAVTIKSFVEEAINNPPNLIIAYEHKQKIIDMYYDKYYKIGDYSVINQITGLKKNYKYLIVDTETNGIPLRISFNAYFGYNNTEKYNTSRIVQLSWLVCDKNGDTLEDHDYIIQPNGFKIENSEIHGITEIIARTKGRGIRTILEIFVKSLANVDYIVCHNVNFDINVIKSEMYRLGRIDMINNLDKKLLICTLETANDCIKKLGRLKSSKLEELYEYFTNEKMQGAHNSKFDVLATKTVFCSMVNQGYLLLPKLE